jgi:hypothetical protein
MGAEHRMHAQGGTRRFAHRLDALLINCCERRQFAGGVRSLGGGLGGQAHLSQPRRLDETLQIEIIVLSESLGQSQERDELAAGRAAQPEQESAELEQQAEHPTQEIEALAGERPPRIGAQMRSACRSIARLRMAPRRAYAATYAERNH